MCHFFSYVCTFKTITNQNVQIMTGIIISLILGAVAGWLAGNIMRGGGFGLLWNIIIGVIGGFIGSFVMNLLHVNTGGGIVWQVIVGVIGACLLLWIISLFKKK